MAHIRKVLGLELLPKVEVILSTEKTESLNIILSDFLLSHRKEALAGTDSIMIHSAYMLAAEILIKLSKAQRKESI